MSLKLEALESFSSYFNFEGNSRCSWSDIENHKMFDRILKPFKTGACNWLLAGIADTLESNTKLSLAMQYISKLLKEHPSWPLNGLAFSQKLTLNGNNADQDEKQVCECMRKMETAISVFERKYLVKSVDFANTVML